MIEKVSHDKNTKQRILEVANVLFAKHGFGNTSVRDIASAADVNLSAVNYHFKNKERLYWKVFDYNYDKICLKIEEIFEKSGSVEDMAVSVLEFFIDDGTAIMNTLKIFLSDTGGVPEEGLVIDKPEQFGPPGQKFFLEKLKQEIPPGVSHEDCLWAVDMIFCLICHIGMLMNTSLVKGRYKDKPEFDRRRVTEELRRSARLHVEALKQK